MDGPSPRTGRDGVSETDSQFWDMDDIMEALRVANRRGISIHELFNHPSGPEILRRAS